MNDNPTPVRRPLLPPRARPQHHEAPRSGQPLHVCLEKRGRCRWRGALTDFARLNALHPWEIFALQEQLEESGQATLDAQNAPDEASTLHYEPKYEPETDATR